MVSGTSVWREFWIETAHVVLQRPITNMRVSASAQEPTNAEVNPKAATDSPLMTPHAA